MGDVNKNDFVDWQKSVPEEKRGSSNKKSR